MGEEFRDGDSKEGGNIGEMTGDGDIIIGK